MGDGRPRPLLPYVPVANILQKKTFFSNHKKKTLEKSKPQYKASVDLLRSCDCCAAAAGHASLQRKDRSPPLAAAVHVTRSSAERFHVSCCCCCCCCCCCTHVRVRGLSTANTCRSYSYKFSTKPGWHTFAGRPNNVLLIDLRTHAARAGSHNGRAGRLADAPRGLEGREDVPGINMRRSGPCRGAMRSNAHRR